MRYDNSVTDIDPIDNVIDVVIVVGTHGRLVGGQSTNVLHIFCRTFFITIKILARMQSSYSCHIHQSTTVD